MFLTTGSRTLPLFHREALARGTEVFARLCPGSVADSALECGFPRDRVVWGRGRIPIKAWRRILRDLDVDSLATKESGEEGGLPEKIEACALEGVDLHVLVRPPPPPGALSKVEEVVARLQARRGNPSEGVRP
jgi:precorrin-6x reductase